MNNEEMKKKIIEMLKKDEEEKRTGSRQYKMGIEILKRYFNYEYEV